MLRGYFYNTLIGFLLFICGSNLFSASAWDIVGDISKQEVELIKDVADRRLDMFDMFRAAMVVSGIKQDSYNYYISHFDKIKAYISKLNGSKYDIAKKIFLYLHKRYLLHYIENITSFQMLFRKGIYNCVSSSAIYNIACNVAGIKTAITMHPDHVFSRLYIDGRWIEAETTSKRGFDPARSYKEATAIKAFIRYRKGNRENSDYIRLLSLFYYNRGVSIAKKGDHKKAMELFARSYLIDPTNPYALTNMGASCVNYAITLAEGKNFDKAISYINIISSIISNDTVVKNKISIIKNAISYYSQSGNLSKVNKWLSVLKPLVNQASFYKIADIAFGNTIFLYAKGANYKEGYRFIMELPLWARQLPNVANNTMAIFKKWAISKIKRDIKISDIMEIKKIINIASEMGITKRKEIDNLSRFIFTTLISKVYITRGFEWLISVLKAIDIPSKSEIIDYLYSYHLSHLVKQNKYDKVIEIVRKAMSNGYLKGAKDIIIGAYINYGATLYNKGMYKRAIKVLQDGYTKTRSRKIYAYINKILDNIVISLVNKGRFNSAKEYIHKYIRSISRYVIRYYYAKYIEGSINKGNTELALDIARMAIKDFPNDKYFLYIIKKWR